MGAVAKLVDYPQDANGMKIADFLTVAPTGIGAPDDDGAALFGQLGPA